MKELGDKWQLDIDVFNGKLLTQALSSGTLNRVMPRPVTKIQAVNLIAFAQEFIEEHRRVKAPTVC